MQCAKDRAAARSTPETRAAQRKRRKERQPGWEAERARARRAADPGRDKRYYAANKDKVLASVKAWQEANPEKARSYKRRWEEANPEAKRAAVKRRREIIQAATPPWLSEEQKASIRDIYADAARIQKATGVRHHVDHIDPLMGKSSCGLHVPWNLQILTAAENIQKGNRPHG